jgi:hypothetical protein
MATLGQRLKENTHTYLNPVNHLSEQVAARQAGRVKALLDSLTEVVEKAKADITRAIEAGKDEYCIQSKVPESKEAYRILNGYRNHNTFFMATEVLEPVWNGFLGWAESEELRIEMVSCLPDIVDGERKGGCYLLIRARPKSSRY